MSTAHPLSPEPGRTRSPRRWLAAVPRGRPTAPRTPFVLLLTLLLLGGVVGLLLFNTSMQQASFAITNLEQQATSLTAREQTLRRELQELRDPQRLARQATRMGMVPAPNPAFVRLSDGTVLGKPTPAQPGDKVRIQPLPRNKPDQLTPPARVVTVPRSSAR